MSVLVEIKRSLTKLLDEKFSDFKIYAEEIPKIIENGQFKDYFFVEIVPVSVNTENKYQTRYNLLININCQTMAHNNEKYYEIASELDTYIRPTFRFKDRNLTVEKCEYKVVDRIMKYKFNVEFIEDEFEDESYPTMETLERRVY